MTAYPKVDHYNQREEIVLLALNKFLEFLSLPLDQDEYDDKSKWLGILAGEIAAFLQYRTWDRFGASAEKAFDILYNHPDRSGPLYTQAIGMFQFLSSLTTHYHLDKTPLLRTCEEHNCVEVLAKPKFEEKYADLWQVLLETGHYRGKQHDGYLRVGRNTFNPLGNKDKLSCSTLELWANGAAQIIHNWSVKVASEKPYRDIKANEAMSRVIIAIRHEPLINTGVFLAKMKPDVPEVRQILKRFFDLGLVYCRFSPKDVEMKFPYLDLTPDGLEIAFKLKENY